MFGGGVNETIKKDAATIVSQKAVIDASASANILKVATNLFIGFLGKKNKAHNIGNSGYISKF